MTVPNDSGFTPNQVLQKKKKSDEAAAAEVLQNEIRSINHFKNNETILPLPFVILKAFKKVFLRNFFLSAH